MIRTSAPIPGAGGFLPSPYIFTELQNRFEKIPKISYDIGRIRNRKEKDMGWEFTILDALQQIHTPLLDKILVFITSLGNAGWFWIVLGLVLLCVKKYRKYGVLVLGALILSALFGNIILKPLVARQRPCWINDTVELLIRVPKDYSFPSGHTQASFAAATALFTGNKKAGICAYVLAALIAFSRLYMYVHFPTDVMAGIVIGICCGLLSAYVFGCVKSRRMNPNK